MSQDDPRGNLSTFGDFGLYSTSSAENQSLKSGEMSSSLFDAQLSGQISMDWGPMGYPGYGTEMGPILTEKQCHFVASFNNGKWNSEPNTFNLYGWLRTGSLARTYDGYQAGPTAINAIHSFLGPMARLFFGPSWGEYVTRANIPYQNLEGTQKMPVDYVWACPPSQGLPDRLLPYYYTDTDSISFRSVYDREVELSSSFEVLLGRIYQAAGAILAILSGGTLANYGGEDTSSRVVEAVTESTSLTEDGEGVSVSERLARIESAVSQLIALTTYSYYISGASVDSAPASGSSVAEGVLNYLKQFLGSGAPDPVPPPEEDGEEGSEEEEK